MKTLVTFTFAACLLLQTFTRAFAQALPNDAAVTILSKGDKNEIPPDAAPKGSIKIGDGMRLNCGYTETMERARAMAREKGGNLVKITGLKEPGALSSCYRLHADVYYCRDATTRFAYKDELADSIVHALIPDTASYSLLFAYRLRGGVGPLIRYQLNVDDSEVALMRLGSAYVVKLDKPGRTKIWARTESEKSILLDVKPRKVYFVRAAVQMGIMVGRPQLEIMTTPAGLREFNKNEDRLEAKKRKKGKDKEISTDE